MEFHFVLAEASSRYNSLFFVLFLAFAIAAIIWMLLWLFSDGSSEESPSGQGGESCACAQPGA
jgi:uncharacterized membrane protein YciS (DUF1049 family)